jgi:hypothetical protein
MSRAVYALVVDCTEESEMIPALLAQVVSVIEERGWPEVRAAIVSSVVPLEADAARQDPERTQPEVTLVFTG